ncbi:hypothetical protein GCM10027046_23030 [Uliginosibacterium flavum]
MVRCESLLEMAAVELAEFSRGVVAIDEQPVNITYQLDGKSRRYTPDFRFKWENGEQWYVEVKPLELLNEPANIARFAAIARFFEAQGAAFVVLTERQLKLPVRNKQIKYLLRYMPRVPTAVPVQILQQWCPGHSFSFLEAERMLGGSSQLLGLLAQRTLVCDLDKPRSPDTVVRLFCEGDDHALFA